MTKKRTRRQYQARPEGTQQPLSAGSRFDANGTPSATVGGPAKAAPAADVGQEYRYVIADLKRIGITAASMFALLVVLALFLT